MLPGSSTTRSRRVTIKDVARLAGVSHTTVSWVLNDKPGVKIAQTTRERIRAAAAKLGYRVNQNARSLSTTVSNSIGLVTEDLDSTRFAGATVAGAQRVIWDSGKLMQIVHTDGNGSFRQSAFERLLQREIEALIFATLSHRPFDVPESLGELPLVLMNCYDEYGRYSHVVPDEFGGAYQAVSYLVGQGHERIGFIADARGGCAAGERLAGYRWAIEESGLVSDPRLISSQDATLGGGYLGARYLLDLARRPSAIFCVNDWVAMGCYEAVKEAGFAIGRDIAVIGFEDTELAAQMRPGLSTVALPHAEMGRWAAQHVLTQLRSDHPLTPVHKKMPCPLILRDSA